MHYILLAGAQCLIKSYTLMILVRLLISSMSIIQNYYVCKYEKQQIALIKKHKQIIFSLDLQKLNQIIIENHIKFWKMNKSHWTWNMLINTSNEITKKQIKEFANWCLIPAPSNSETLPSENFSIRCVYKVGERTPENDDVNCGILCISRDVRNWTIRSKYCINNKQIFLITYREEARIYDNYFVSTETFSVFPVTGMYAFEASSTGGFLGCQVIIYVRI